jgi:hypothetical protein
MTNFTPMEIAIIKRSRINILDTLELISSSRLQLDYSKNVPRTEEFVKTDEWQMLANAAQTALNKLDKLK